jgi:hypothetical protein
MASVCALVYAAMEVLVNNWHRTSAVELKKSTELAIFWIDI